MRKRKSSGPVSDRAPDTAEVNLPNDRRILQGDTRVINIVTKALKAGGGVARFEALFD